MTLLDLLAWVLVCAIAVPVLALTLECFAGLLRVHRAEKATGLPPIVVLMPAHDEAAAIERSVRAVMLELRPCDRLLVIADNCADDTAQLARDAGACVIERNDPEERGKSHALAFGRTHLLHDRDLRAARLVMLVDADCRPSPGAIALLARAAWREQAAVQGGYLLVPATQAEAIIRVSCFAFLVKNMIRQRGLQRLAGAALLQGSGMAFPAPLFQRLHWDRQSLVEDLDMGIRLLLSGERVLFEEQALFFSDASSQAGTAGQRRRWEHGMMQSMSRNVRQLLGAVVQGRFGFLMLALDQCIPPTIVLAASALGVTLVSVLAFGLHAAVQFLLVCDVLLGLSLVLVWARHGRRILSGRCLLTLPSYVGWKLLIALQFFTRRQREWLRTDRQT